ncbi:hypothetical protein B0T16DRAFT_205717 [Cercophora newfieldiana]|uniref:Uncharacterized protein n=1 Tax=Cercophora newfieldiana TaxID=92897 RepID=A0AA39XWP8_9PEZI|nr:hypothetical protein B0T16DRAFT_205717 [Cercophora newfieldiana]
MPPLAANRQVQAQTKANSPEEGEIRDAAIKMEAYSSTEKAVVAQTAPPSAPKNHRVRAEQSSSNTPTQPRSTPMNRTYHGPGAQKQGTEDKLARLVEEDADLRDWLLMTNYYDVELRNKRLDRHRKVVALTAEKERIEAEQRKLIEEDEHDRMQGVVPTSVTPAPNSVPFTAPPTTVAPEQIDNSRANKEQVSAKRPLDAYEQHGRPEKYQRSSRPVSRDEFKPHAHRRTPSRGSSPPRHGHSHFRRDYSPRSRDYSPHRGPPYDNGYASYRRETGSDDRPVEVDLGQKGGQFSSKHRPFHPFSRP